MKRIIALILLIGMAAGAVFCQEGYAEEKNPAAENGEEISKPELELYAQSAVLMDAVSGRVLYGKNEDVIRPMASTTKIMTCIVALEHGNPESVVTASSQAARQPAVHLGVREGQKFYLKDLLYSLMLESHNDAAVMVAEGVGGSEEEFAVLMNQKARDLGCSDTYFITPNGLDASFTDQAGVKHEHSTTAADLSRIMRYCVLESPKREEFLEITGTQNYFFTDAEGKGSYNCTNHNAFLTMMEGMMSGKTGFTGGAGYSYVAALKDGDRVFVIALLGCGWPPHKTYKWSDARKLFRLGLDRYEYREVFEEPELKPVVVEEGVPDSGLAGDVSCVPISLGLTEKEKTLKLLMGPDEKASVKTEIPARLRAPVRKGETVGSVTYSLEGRPVKTYSVYAEKTVDRIGFSWCFEKVWRQFFLINDKLLIKGT